MNKQKGASILPVVVVVVILVAIGYGVYLYTSPSASHPVTTSTSSVTATYPEPKDYVVDTTGTIPQAKIDALSAKLKSLDNTKHQFGVAIIRTTGNESIEQYGIHLAEKWRAGDAKTDTGAIVIIAIDSRQVRLEIGDGLESKITDSEAGRIIDTKMMAYLEAQDWAGAASAAVDAMALEADK